MRLDNSASNAEKMPQKTLRDQIARKTTALYMAAKEKCHSWNFLHSCKKGGKGKKYFIFAIFLAEPRGGGGGSIGPYADFFPLGPLSGWGGEGMGLGGGGGGSGGSQEGVGGGFRPLHSRGSPNKGGQNQNWLPHPCLLREAPARPPPSGASGWRLTRCEYDTQVADHLNMQKRR